MTEQMLTWRQRIDDARAEGLAAREYFVVFTRPKASREAVQQHLAIHLEYQRELERRGVIVAAGPLSDEQGWSWTGKGMIILRAESLAAARAIADADPMHRDGVRSYEILPWLMNEGSFSLKVSLAAQKVEFA
ncbi:MAG: YciI family protein [Pseudomonadota bacterium]